MTPATNLPTGADVARTNGLSPGLHETESEGVAASRPVRPATWPQVLPLAHRSSCSRYRLQLHQLDSSSVAPEILGVEGEQTPFAMRQHGRCDVGIVDLLSRDGNLAA